MKPLRAIALLLLASTLALATSPKISKDLAAVNPSSTVNVVIQFNTFPGSSDFTQLAKYGQPNKTFKKLPVVVIPLKLAMVKLLALLPNIKYMSLDRPLKGKLDLTAAAVNAAAAVGYSLDGTGVGIAIIDSGITQNPDLMNSAGLASRIVYSQDFTGLGSTDDAYGHGTHVAGIAAGNGASSSASADTRTFRGIAPGANIINLRVLDNNGQAVDSTVIQAIDQAIALQSQYNIRVINLSLGRAPFESYTLDPMCQAVEAAWQAGIVVVVAAGNEGRTDTDGIEGYGTIADSGRRSLRHHRGRDEHRGHSEPDR